MASFAQTPTGDIVICLAPDELRGLSVLATEGAAALLSKTMLPSMPQSERWTQSVPLPKSLNLYDASV
jgi:hypothetical protein